MNSQTITTRGKQRRYYGEGRQERGQFIVHDKLSQNFKKNKFFLLHNIKVNLIIRAISKSHQFISNNKKVIQMFMVQGFHHVFLYR